MTPEALGSFPFQPKSMEDMDSRRLGEAFTIHPEEGVAEGIILLLGLWFWSFSLLPLISLNLYYSCKHGEDKCEGALEKNLGGTTQGGGPIEGLVPEESPAPSSKCQKIMPSTQTKHGRGSSSYFIQYEGFLELITKAKAQPPMPATAQSSLAIVILNRTSLSLGLRLPFPGLTRERAPFPRHFITTLTLLSKG